MRINKHSTPRLGGEPQNTTLQGAPQLYLPFVVAGQAVPSSECSVGTVAPLSSVVRAARCRFIIKELFSNVP